MIDIYFIEDLELLREAVDLECKLAAGRDGQGALPEDFWPTYSAFANTEGGVVLLGMREKRGRFYVEGIANIAKVRKELFDYQERPETKSGPRWLDRLTLDGKWSGNLYDFYRRVYMKLTADLKVPFRLEKGERTEETPIHVALREALANVLVHADYSDRASVLIVKRPDMFGFRNPGLMRIPVEIALQGGEADCRNRTLHKMFRFVGMGEQAGTGIPKILQGWQSQHWRPPILLDTSEPYNQTLLRLRMIDLFPEPIIARLKARLGTSFEALNYVERVALALAASEGTVNHARLRAVTTEHPVDLSRTLQHLTQIGALQSTGGRGAIYHLAGDEIPTPEDVFGPTMLQTTSSLNLGASSPNLASSSLNLGEKRSVDGCLVTDQLPLPIIDDLNLLSQPLRARLEELAAEPREKGKVDRAVLISVLLKLCAEHFVTLRCLATLVDRKPETLRQQYLMVLVRERRLILAFPTTPTHERQAYRTAPVTP